MQRVDIKTVKVTNMNLRYCMDEMCAAYNPEDNSWSIFFNGEIFEGHTPKDFLSKLDEIAKLLKSTKNYDEIFICYIPDLLGVSAMLPEGIANEYVKKGKKSYTFYRTKHYEFREYNMFARASGRKIQHAAKMHALLSELCELAGVSNICNLKYSSGWVVKKALVLGHEEEIKQWYYDTKNYRDSIEHFNEQLIGNKGGLLKANKGIFEDVLMIDIKSAYLSAFKWIQDFPTGRLVRSTGNRALINIMHGNWYHFIIKTKEVIDEFYDFADENDTKCYGFYRYDENMLFDNGIKLKEIVYNLVTSGDAEVISYQSSSYGPLPKCVVDKMQYLYDRKQETKDDPDRKECYKIMTEYIYGKFMQADHGFQKDSEVVRFFKLPDNVIRPEYSMLACSLVRWRLSRMIKELDFSYYNDTDGIETSYSKEKEEIVERQNNLIVEYNKSLGYDSNIGTYEIEAKHAKIGIIARKQRFFIDDNGKTIAKICSLPKDTIDILRKFGYDDIKLFELLTHKITLPVTTFRYDSEFGYVPESLDCNKITLQGCCQEGS